MARQIKGDLLVSRELTADGVSYPFINDPKSEDGGYDDPGPPGEGWWLRQDGEGNADFAHRGMPLWKFGTKTDNFTARKSAIYTLDSSGGGQFVVFLPEATGTQERIILVGGNIPSYSDAVWLQLAPMNTINGESTDGWQVQSTGEKWMLADVAPGQWTIQRLDWQKDKTESNYWAPYKMVRKGDMVIMPNGGVYYARGTTRFGGGLGLGDAVNAFRPVSAVEMVRWDDPNPGTGYTYSPPLVYYTDGPGTTIPYIYMNVLDHGHYSSIIDTQAPGVFSLFKQENYQFSPGSRIRIYGLFEIPGDPGHDVRIEIWKDGVFHSTAQTETIPPSGVLFYHARATFVDDISPGSDLSQETIGFKFDVISGPSGPSVRPSITKVHAFSIRRE